MFVRKFEETEIKDGITFILHNSGLFAVSKCGKILGKSRRILKTKSQGNYSILSYQAANKKIRHKYVHRLVAEVFIENPNNLPYINHINGNKMDNHVDNLEWCSPVENSNHAIKLGLTWNLPSKGQCGFRKKND